MKDAEVRKELASQVRSRSLPLFPPSPRRDLDLTNRALSLPSLPLRHLTSYYHDNPDLLPRARPPLVGIRSSQRRLDRESRRTKEVARRVEVCCYDSGFVL